MKRALIALCAPLALAACAGLPTLTTVAPPAPAPLERGTIDDKGLLAAWQAFDVALDAINLLGDRGWLVPGTPRGKAVASAIRKVNAALAAAERFAAAGSAPDYVTALRDASAGLADLRSILKGS